MSVDKSQGTIVLAIKSKGVRSWQHGDIERLILRVRQQLPLMPFINSSVRNSLITNYVLSLDNPLVGV